MDVLQKYLSEHEAELRDRGVYYLRRSHLARYAGWGERLVEDPGRHSARPGGFTRHNIGKVLLCA